MLDPAESFELGVEWMDAEPPTLEIYRPPVAELADRHKGRTRLGYLKAPRFAQLSVADE
jgi:hypothetical protein